MKTSVILAGLLSISLLLPGRFALGRNYFVNSMTGNDAHAGTGPNQAWQSLARVQTTSFQPGDTVNFAAGSSWNTGLVIRQSGISGKPIVFRAGGDGPKPVFSMTGNMAKAIDIQASWILIDGFLAKDAHYAGVAIAKGAEHNIVRNCEMTNCGGGVIIHGRNNLITHNYAHDLIMIRNTPGGDDDYGAVAYWVFNANNEIAYNRAVRCRAPSYDYGADGGFFESYTNGDSSYVHHNYAEDCNGFLEIGGGLARNIRVTDNVSVENGEWTFHLTGKFVADIQDFRMERNTIISRKGTKWNNVLGLSKGTLAPNAIIFKNNVVVLGGEAGERVAKRGTFIHEGNTYFLLDGAELGYAAGTNEHVNVSY